MRASRASTLIVRDVEIARAAGTGSLHFSGEKKWSQPGLPNPKGFRSATSRDAGRRDRAFGGRIERVPACDTFRSSVLALLAMCRTLERRSRCIRPARTNAKEPGNGERLKERVAVLDRRGAGHRPRHAPASLRRARAWYRDTTSGWIAAVRRGGGARRSSASRRDEADDRAIGEVAAAKVAPRYLVPTPGLS